MSFYSAAIPYHSVKPNMSLTNKPNLTKTINEHGIYMDMRNNMVTL